MYMISFQHILTPSFITFNIFALIDPYYFAELFVPNNDDYLGQKLYSMIPFVPIRIYKRHDLSYNRIFPLFFLDDLKTFDLTSQHCISVNTYNYILEDILS